MGGERENEVLNPVNGARKGRDRRVGCFEQGLPGKCLLFPSMNIS